MSTVNVATDTLTTSTPEPTKQHPTASLPKSPSISAPTQPHKAAPRATVPVVPVLPKNGVVDGSRAEANTSEESSTLRDDSEEQTEASEEHQEAIVAPRPSYRNWADVLKPMAASKASAPTKTGANGTASSDGAEVASEQPSTLGVAKSGTVALAEVLKSYRVGGADKTGERLVFIEPRGLHNSGVDCFMNSVSFISTYLKT